MNLTCEGNDARLTSSVCFNAFAQRLVSLGFHGPVHTDIGKSLQTPDVNKPFYYYGLATSE